MASVSRTISRNGKAFLTAVAYGRFSSNNQREESIDAQFRAIDEYALKNNVNIIEYYSDEALSGKTDERGQFQQMINDIMKGYIKVDVVLVHKFNRFARNKYDSALYKKKLKDIGVKVISVTQNIDDTPEGELLEGFLEVIDQYYSANLTLEVRKGIKENALKGKSNGGKKILGLSVNENGFYYPNEQAHLVRRIYEEYADGVPKTEICRRLNEAGIRNQYGRTFNTRTLYDILRNEKYIGNYIYTINLTETIRLDGIIENPIIDNDLWERVQKVHVTPTKARYRERKRFYHLTGKTICAVCGYPITGAGSKKQKNGDIHSYYKCVGKAKHKNGCTNNSLNKEWFERGVLDAVMKAVFTEKAIKEIAQQAFTILERERETPPTPTKKLEKDLSAILVKQSRLTDLYLDGKMDKDMLDKKNEELQQQKNRLEKEIEKNKQLENSHSLKQSDVENFIKTYVTNILEVKNVSDDDFMKAVFNNFVIDVTVSLDTVDVAVSVNFSNMMGDNRKIGGAIRTLSPITLNQSFKRKTNLYGRIK